ncbi:MAG: hypothetical protein FWE40_07795 [Oscillospiraceae bacterium]|nr:hypothetical protein [Oscillospiraceae bacterium]
MKIFALLLAVVLVFLAACGAPADPAAYTTTAEDAEVYKWLNASDIAHISITWSREDSSFDREYSSPENIARVVDYINTLEFTGVHGYHNRFFGGAFRIHVHMHDGSQRNFTHGGGVFAEYGFGFMYINPEQFGQLFQIIEANPSD